MRSFSNLAPKLLTKLGIQRQFNLTTRVQVLARSFQVPVLGGVGIQNLRPHEAWVGAVLARIVRLKSGAFVDVGVHVGQTLLKYASIRTDGRYFGFEPSAAAASYVQQLAVVNGFNWATILPVGLSDRTKTASLFSSDADTSMASTVEDYFDDAFHGSSSAVMLVAGDALLEELRAEPIAIIKVDVEGGELEVLQGLQSAIRRDHPFIFCEVLPVGHQRTPVGRVRRARTDAITSLMHELGYCMLRIHRDCTIEPLEVIASHDDKTLRDYLFVHEEDREIVLSALKPGRQDDGVCISAK